MNKRKKVKSVVVSHELVLTYPNKTRKVINLEDMKYLNVAHFLWHQAIDDTTPKIWRDALMDLHDIWCLLRSGNVRIVTKQKEV